MNHKLPRIPFNKDCACCLWKWCCEVWVLEGSTWISIDVERSWRYPWREIDWFGSDSPHELRRKQMGWKLQILHAALQNETGLSRLPSGKIIPNLWNSDLQIPRNLSMSFENWTWSYPLKGFKRISPCSKKKQLNLPLLFINSASVEKLRQFYIPSSLFLPNLRN